jgi:hypothetical protein
MSELDATFLALRAFPGAFRHMIAGLPKPLLDWQPDSWEGIPSEMLSVRQQACHVRDIEIDGYEVRFQRLLSEQDPVLESIDTYELVAARDYDRTEIAAALDAFERGRARVLALLANLAPADLDRRGTFEGYGPVSVKGLIHFLCSHDQQHLAGVQWLAGRYASVG